MVATALRSDILVGTYPVSAPLPSELALMERFKVSRHTVRDALRHLRELGLVQSHQGLGTLVVNASGPQRYVHQVNDISELHDFNVDSRYDKAAKKLVLTDDLAHRLGVAAKESWFSISGMRFDRQSSAAMCMVEIFIPARFAGVGRLLGRRPGPIYSLIEEVYGECIGEVQQELRAVPAAAAVSLALGLEPDAMVVEIKRIYRLLHGQIAEITFNYYAAAQFSLSMTLRRVLERPGASGLR
jgi:GntR family transcriptional regulator